MKRSSLNTTPTRHNQRKLSLKSKRPKDGFNYSQQVLTESTLSKSQSSQQTNDIAEAQTNDVFHFHSDESNMNFDVVWDDRPCTPPVNRSRPFFQIENLLKGFPGVESPVARKQIMSLTGMDKCRKQSTPLTSKRKKNNGDISSPLSYLRELKIILQKSKSLQETPNDTLTTHSSLTEEEEEEEREIEEGQKEEESIPNDDDIVLEESIFDHSSIIQQLLSDSFDAITNPSTPTSLYDQTVHHTVSFTTSSPSILAPNSVLCSSRPVNAESILSPSSSQICSTSFKSLPQETHARSTAKSLIPKPQETHTHSTNSIIPKAQNIYTHSFHFIPKLQETCSHNSVNNHKPKLQLETHSLSPSLKPKLQGMHSRSPSLKPKLQGTHSRSPSLKPKLQGTHFRSPSHIPKLNQNISHREKPINTPPHDNTTINNTTDVISDDDDNEFWSHVANLVDTIGQEEEEEASDDFLSNLDKESLNKLFDFDEDTSTATTTEKGIPIKQVCSQDDIKRKKQQAKRKLQSRHRTC